MSKASFERRPHLIPSAIAAMVLLVALAQWPYVYYQVLRWVVCAAAVNVAYRAYRWKRQATLWAFAIVAIIFNPLAPFHLPRGVWQVLNLAGVVVLVAAIIWLTVPPICTQSNDAECGGKE